jgi:hypothetical protein
MRNTHMCPIHCFEVDMAAARQTVLRPHPRAPKRRSYYPLPDRLEHARSPVERCVCLFGGPERLGAALGRDGSTVYAWRARNNGFFPAYMLDHVAEALRAAGWVVPEDFLGETTACFVADGHVVAHAEPSQ